MLLSFIQLFRRAPYGLYAIMVAEGIGGNAARLTIPLGVVLAYIIILNQKELTESGIVVTPYEAAIVAVSVAIGLIGIVIFLSRKIEFRERQLRMLTITDELTGLFNLRGLTLHGEQELLDAKRSGVPSTIIFFDIDNLKKVNDSLGHDQGSALLLEFAQVLRTQFRESDIVSRYGGDEFVVVAHGPLESVHPALVRVEKAIEALNESGGRPYRIEYSSGVVTYDTGSNESFEALVNRADSAMYQNKVQRRVDASQKRA